MIMFHNISFMNHDNYIYDNGSYDFEYIIDISIIMFSTSFLTIRKLRRHEKTLPGPLPSPDLSRAALAAALQRAAAAASRGDPRRALSRDLLLGGMARIFSRITPR